MRNAFHEDLDTISDQLVEMTRLAGSAMARATTALLDADISLAESVIEADKELDAMREHDEEMSALQRQNRLLMNWNAGLALDNAALQFELDRIKGEA